MSRITHNALVSNDPKSGVERTAFLSQDTVHTLATSSGFGTPGPGWGAGARQV